MPISNPSSFVLDWNSFPTATAIPVVANLFDDEPPEDEPKPKPKRVVKKVPINPDCGEKYNVCTHSFCTSPNHTMQKMTYAQMYKYSRAMGGGERYFEKCKNCTGCVYCCKCFTCGHCARVVNRYIEAICSYCKLCTKCCKCTHCSYDGCMQRGPANQFCTHGHCKHHRSCCVVTIFWVKPVEPVRFWSATRKEFYQNTNKRHVAAEIEVANSSKSTDKLSEVVMKYGGGVVEDHSLTHGGFEITTAPANGDLWVKQIEELCLLLNNIKAIVNETCGLHVHVDARDYTHYELRRLILLYERLEAAIFHMVPVDRRTHHNQAGTPYSGPCGFRFANPIRQHKSGEDSKLAILSALYLPINDHGLSLTSFDDVKEFSLAKKRRLDEDMEYYRKEQKKLKPESRDYKDYDSTIQQMIAMYEHETGLKQFKEQKRVPSRYAAVNFHSFYHLQTIEVRMHEGTVDPKAIINWGIIWADIVNWALTHSEADIEALGPAIHFCYRHCPCQRFRYAKDVSKESLAMLKQVTTRPMHEYIDRKFDMYANEYDL